MTFKPALWYPIAVLLSIGNLVGAGFAAGPGQALHVTTHAALALAFGLWAQRLQHGPGTSELKARLEALEALELESLEALDGEVGRLRQELGETQERLDFAERMLAQGSEMRRVGPEHQGPKQPDRAER